MYCVCVCYSRSLIQQYNNGTVVKIAIVCSQHYETNNFIAVILIMSSTTTNIVLTKHFCILGLFYCYGRI